MSDPVVDRLLLDTAVVVPGRFAAQLEHYMPELRRRATERGDELVVAVSAAIEVAADRHRTVSAAAGHFRACDRASGPVASAQVDSPWDPSNQLTARDAAAVLGVTSSAVRLWANEGQLPGRKVNGTWWFDAETIDNELRRRSETDGDDGSGRDGEDRGDPQQVLSAGR